MDSICMILIICHCPLCYSNDCGTKGKRRNVYCILFLFHSITIMNDAKERLIFVRGKKPILRN